MPKKSRFPQHLGWEDFLSFMRELIMWLMSQVGDPDHQPSFEVGMEAKVDDYEAALTTYKMKKDLSPEKKKLKDAAIKVLRVALTRVKDTLPVFFANPDILGQFGIAGSIETDEDELYIQASGCMGHWAMVSGDPEFAPLVPDFTVAQTAFDDFVAKRQDFTLTFQAMQAAQNDMEELRIPIQEQERKIFDWYRSRHSDSNDPWWTDTPWGTSSGEEPPAPDWPDWPGPVEASAEQIDEGLVRITFSGLNGGKTLRIDRLKQGDADYVLVTQGLPLDDPEEVMPFDDNHLDKKKYTYKLTPFDEVGNPGMPALVEVTVS